MTSDEQTNQDGEPRVGGEAMSETEIDYNLMASFPASDPVIAAKKHKRHKCVRNSFVLLVPLCGKHTFEAKPLVTQH